ncbi:O-methyltransferase [Flavisolibacter ginsengisoli]|jgi:predicted O-methyltransferase YrrM|uniref:Predicted O-methyltransferase YrrM n=1 Tax=Flavisolibacter ginsengisoli DSM 18119 TaxID=1121884 RepID=A0A1M5EY27_9BACT|nr:O-methyltransferase [Flavisolibacter ginsengisoli]SHF84047.1 Predicted O-methyltransferase YrrM [Flavisolibacter ginsengisoli DSM 18119]
MELINPLVQSYAEKYTSGEDALLQEIAAFTCNNHPKAHMLSGHIQGKFLEMVSHMTRPKRILEIGTFTGYSALCLAKGLEEGGVLHTLELREEDANTAKAYFDRSFFKDQIILHIGDALELIGEIDELWDLVFIDADKENYINYFNLVLPKLKPKGFILADNVLFHGQVLEEPVKGKNAKAIQAFNDYVAGRDDVERLLLPLRDGLYLIRKLH